MTGEAPASASAPCGACGASLVAGARFCEACGAAANGTGGRGTTPEAAGGDAAGHPTLEVDDFAGGDAGDPAVACDRCGGDVGADGYCTSCGHRALEPVDVVDGAPLAYATHRGRRHNRNEDSAALAVTDEGWPVLVVSDGVSVSPNPHRASAAAVAAAAGRLADRPFGGADDLAEAVADAHAAACAVPNDDDPQWTPDGSHPACTIVVAVATAGSVHLANVGDARAHLLHRDGDRWVATQLSTDDSVAAQAVAQGIDPDVALNLPGGHGITAWLGADATGLAPHVAEHPAAPGDVLLVCSDGLWNYAATDPAMGELLTATYPRPDPAPAPTAPACERLVTWANDQGGADNVTVAMTPLPPDPEENP